MQEVEPTFKRIVAIWWLLAWRGFVGSFLIGGVIGFIMGFIAAAMGYPQGTATDLITVISALAGLIWAFFVVRMALTKKYKGFRIALIAETEPAVSTPPV